MKVRKKYTIRISGLQRVIWLARPSYMTADYFSKMYDCNFEQAKNHLKLAQEHGYYLSKVRKRRRFLKD